MCGICGIAYADPERRVNESTVSEMNRALLHRGPDDSGLWHGGHVALAMRRLSIIDLFRGHQPMTSEDGSVVVVFNGEIYNFKQLRSDLEQRGHEFGTLSDTEVILRAYEEYGDDCMLHFNGMFAFAIYDKTDDRLLLARDRLGIKPLFYTFHEGALAFASELDALLRSGLVSGELNPAAIDAFFAYLYVPAPDCVFRRVFKLCPGEKLVFHGGQITKDRYWRLSFEPQDSWSLDAAAEEYMALLRDAITLQRVSDVPLGALLSGGIDSSSVVGVLSMVASAPIQTFTIGFDDAHYDELAFAKKAALHFGTNHTEEIMRPDMVAIAGQLARHFGEPFADSSAVPTWLVSQVARRRVTVALSGDGGDELFAGYTWTHMSRRVASYRRTPAPLRSLADVALRLFPYSPVIGKLRRFSQDSFLAPDEVFRRRHTCFGDDLRARLYLPELANAVWNEAVDRYREHADSAPSLSDEDRMLYLDTVMYLPDDILTKVDRMSMANSLEVRVPLLDHRIVEFAATLPFHVKFKRGVSKRVAKRAIRDALPRELLRQRKQGFSIPIHRWFRKELRGHFDEVVLEPSARNGRFLDSRAVRHLRDAHVQGRENLGHHLWALLMFEHWLRYMETVQNVSLG